jgi:hypothetical protein
MVDTIGKYGMLVNAGLRGHQFVKEGAEEVLECCAFAGS